MFWSFCNIILFENPLKTTAFKKDTTRTKLHDFLHDVGRKQDRFLLSYFTKKRTDLHKLRWI